MRHIQRFFYRFLPLAVVLTAAVTSPTMASELPVPRGELVLETDNDFLASNPEQDDLYTFAVTLGWDVRRHTLRLREMAFTDRHAGIRFDETYLTVGRRLPAFHGWTGSAQAGVARVGRGIFGQSAQNALHRIIGSEQVDLAYLDPSVHPYVRLDLEHPGRGGRRLAVGPAIELQAAAGFKSTALLSWRLSWDPSGPFAFGVGGGVRWARSDLEELEAWIEDVGPAGTVEVAYRDRYVLAWSYNAYGTGREHVSLRYRLSRGWARPAGR